MKKSKITAIVFVLIAVVFSVASIATVYAAYYGKGLFKDVFVNKRSYFFCDVLESVGDKESVGVGDHRINFGAEKGYIDFYNYDTSTGEFNGFDIDFDVYAWTDAAYPQQASAYTVGYDGTEKQADTTTKDTPLFRVRLAGGKVTSVKLTVSFGLGDTEPTEDYPDLYVFAVPVTPAYLSSKMFGAAIEPSKTEAFRLEGYFQNAPENKETAIDDETAAFLYIVTATGEKPDANIRIKWNSKAVTPVFEIGSLTGASVKDLTETGFDKCIDLPGTADFYYRLTFMRVQDLPEGETNVWEKDVTWQDLEGYISCETVEA